MAASTGRTPRSPASQTLSASWFIAEWLRGGLFDDTPCYHPLGLAGLTHGDLVPARAAPGQRGSRDYVSRRRVGYSGVTSL